MNTLIDTDNGLNFDGFMLRVFESHQGRQNDSQGGIECPIGINIKGQENLCMDCIDYGVCVGANVELGVPDKEGLSSVVELSLRG